VGLDGAARRVGAVQEGRDIDVLLRDVEDVAGGPADDRSAGGAPVTQDAAQVGDVGLEAGGDARRRVVAPDRRHEPVGGHDASAGEQQHREDRPLLGRPEVDPRLSLHHLEGAQHAVVHGVPSFALAAV